MIIKCNQVQLSEMDPHLIKAKLATVLLLIEQLVPVLTEDVLQSHVVPLCLPCVYELYSF